VELHGDAARGDGARCVRDRPDAGLLCRGVGGNGPRPWLGPGNLAVYYIGVRRKLAQFD
jgi:hypothetical protein